MTDNRKVQLEASLDASGVKKGAQEASAAVSGMATSISESSAAGAQKFDRSTAAMIGSIQRTAAAMDAGGRNTSEYFRLLAQQKGVDTTSLKPYLDQLDAVNAKQRAAQAATMGTNAAYGGLGMTAKATNAALRQVPQQLTDIVVSLQGGQAPLTVLLQQGGQLKDIFGGVGAAAKAMGGYLLTLINPFTVVAAAVAAVGVAYYQGSKETDAYRNSLILTGNATGTTIGLMQTMATEIAKTASVTKGAAAEALTVFANNSGIVSDQMERVTVSALRLQKEGGVAVAKTVEQFAALGKDPLAASLKLNESTGHLTTATYLQIKALIEQGHVLEAGRVAQIAYADAIDSRTANMVQNLGYVERAWRGVMSTAKDAWDSMLDIGRGEDSGAESIIQRTQSRIAALQQKSAPGRGIFSGRSADEDKELATLQAVLVKQQAIAKTAQEAAKAEGERTRDGKDRAKFDEDSLKYYSESLKLSKLIAKSEGEVSDLVKRGVITATEGAARIAAIKLPTQKAFDKATLEYNTAVLQKELDTQLNLYDNYNKKLDALHASGAVSDRDYYAAKQAALSISSKLTVDALNAEIDLEKRQERKRQSELFTGAERGTSQKESDKRVLDLQSKLNKEVETNTSKSAVLIEQQAAAISSLARAYAEAEQSAQAYLNATARGFAREQAGVARGDIAREDIAGRGAIEERAVQDRQRTLNQMALDKRAANDPEIREAYMARLRLVGDTATAETAMWKDAFDKRRMAEADWSNGAIRALENYADNSANISKGMEGAFTNAMSNMTDEMLKMTETGSFNFGNMARSIIADLLRIKTQQLITGPIASGVMGMLGGGGGGAAAATGGGAVPMEWYNAKGNAFAANTGLESYRNTVVNKPTMFAFAQGVMGEKVGSPGEAIMPLTRMANNDLGVHIKGGGVSINYAPVINIDSRTDRFEVARVVDQAVRNGNAQLMDSLRRTGRM